MDYDDRELDASEVRATEDVVADGEAVEEKADSAEAEPVEEEVAEEATDEAKEFDAGVASTADPLPQRDPGSEYVESKPENRW